MGIEERYPVDHDTLDLAVAGITVVIRATGYSLVRQVKNGDGYPIKKRGVTKFDGLYFLGMP